MGKTTEMFGGIEARTIPGPALSIACPVCGNDTRATSYQYGERATVLHLFPVSPYAETNYVKCESCGELFLVDKPVFELATCSPHELSRLLRRHIPLIPLSMAVFGILLFPFPIVGLAVNAIALLLNWRRLRHWTRSASIAGLILSVPFTAVFVVWAVLAANS